jgi:hypothetical protein
MEYAEFSLPLLSPIAMDDFSRRDNSDVSYLPHGPSEYVPVLYVM